jgi:hypothetical protein
MCITTLNVFAREQALEVFFEGLSGAQTSHSKQLQSQLHRRTIEEDTPPWIQKMPRLLPQFTDLTH